MEHLSIRENGRHISAPGIIAVSLELTDLGTSAYGTYKRIYDTDLHITWYDFAEMFDPASGNGSQQAVDRVTDLPG